MKPFYSVEELQKIWKQTFAEDIELWTIASAFSADGISAIYQGQPADLTQWYQLTPIHIPGEGEPFVEAEYPWPEPADVLVFSDSLPQLWKDCISRYESRETMEIPSQSKKKEETEQSETEKNEETERNRLLKQIGGLALLLAEKVSRYKRGDVPNVKQIADAVAELLQELPDAHTYGLGHTNMRVSIAEGLKLLKK